MIRYCEIIYRSKHEISSVTVNGRHFKVVTEDLTRKWDIGLWVAKGALEASTYNGVHTTIHPFFSRLSVDNLHLHRSRIYGA